MKFAFGGNTGETYESLQRKRRMAEALMAPGPAPRNVGEGLSYIGRMLGGGLAARSANKREAKERDAANASWNENESAIYAQLLGGGSQPQTAAPTPHAAPSGASGNLPLYGDQGPTRQAKALAESGNVDAVYSGLIDKGAPPHVAAALVGNLIQESGPSLNTTAVGDGGAAFGMGQWNGPRKDALMAWAQQSGRDPNDVATQTDYLWHELQGPERGAFDAIMAAPDLQTATRIASEKYWRPGDPRMENRLRYAQQVADRFGAGSPQQDGQGIAHRGTGSPMPQPGVQVAQAGGVDPALLQALAGSASNEFLDPGKRAIAAALLEQAIEQAAPMTRYQQAQIAQGERQMAMDDGQFRATHGLNVAEYDQARREFMATHDLSERQFEENKGQFQAELAIRQEQLGIERDRLGVDREDRDADNARADAQLELEREKARTTGTLSEYDRYAQQETDAGRQPLGFLEYQTALKQAGQSPEKPSSMQEKIGLLESSGLDRETAIGIATGRLATSRDPITGQAQIVDKGTGQVVGAMPAGAPSWAITGDAGATQQPLGPNRPPLTISPSALPPQREMNPAQPSPAGNLYGRTGEGTGVVSGAKELSSNTLGQLPGGIGDFFSFPAKTETRQAFRAATGDLIRAFSVNPRFPVSEMERIREQLGVEPAIWSDPEAMQSRMVAIDAYLRSKLAAEQQAANDPSLPADQRQASIGTARAIEQYLGLLGVPPDAGQRQQQGQQGGNVAQPSSEREYNSLPPGTLYMAPDGTTRRKP